MELRERQGELLARDGAAAGEEFFEAIQNARLAANAERYYRTMFKGRVVSWNVRDEHMADTLEELMTHFRTRGRSPKIVVWAHNSHLGDARATEMGELGELNLGQLARERHGPNVCSIGFTTYTGDVIAASDWGERPQRKRVRAALGDSYEELFHDMGISRFFLPMSPGSEVHELLSRRRLERAIGVIYRPDTERWSHYFRARLAAQFDAIIHIDESRAVEPLEGEAAWDEEEVPETFPSGV
jgi:erythromycin esterase-like protein